MFRHAVMGLMIVAMASIALGQRIVDKDPPRFPAALKGFKGTLVGQAVSIREEGTQLFLDIAQATDADGKDVPALVKVQAKIVPATVTQDGKQVLDPAQVAALKAIKAGSKVSATVAESDQKVVLTAVPKVVTE